MPKNTAPKLPTPKYIVLDPEGKHRYQIWEENAGCLAGDLDSVTGVLNVINKPALVNWAAGAACDLIKAELLGALDQNVRISAEWIDSVVAAGRKRPKQIKDQAADVGSQAHAAFEGFLKGETLMIAVPEIKDMVGELEKWHAQSKTTIVATELPVGSLLHRFGGRIDAIGWRDGKWGLPDWKTSSGIYPEMALQVAGGYAIAIEEQYGIKIEWADIVRFSKKAPWGMEIKPVVDMAAAKRGFFAAMALQRELGAQLLGEATYSTFAQRAEQSAAEKKVLSTKLKKKTAAVGF